MGTWAHAKDSGTGAPGRIARRGERMDRDRDRQPDPKALPEIERALGLVPSTHYVMTAAYENRRAGILVSKVMRCGSQPSLISVAVPAGQRLATLIRDSHAFGLCMVDRGSRLLTRKFAEDDGGVHASPLPAVGDPFDTLEVRTLVTGSPLLARSIMALDCEVVRHLDLEGDHEIYVGMVLSAFVSNGGGVAGRNTQMAAGEQAAASHHPGDDALA